MQRFSEEIGNTVKDLIKNGKGTREIYSLCETVFFTYDRNNPFEDKKVKIIKEEGWCNPNDKKYQQSEEEIFLIDTIKNMSDYSYSKIWKKVLNE